MRVATMPMQGWLATPTRRNALKGIFIAPAVLMLGVAVQSRPNYIDYDRLIDNQEVDRRITAYVDVVRATDPVIENRKKVDPTAADQVANLWIESAEQGKLQPLPTQGFDDSIHLGVKGQVLASAKGLTLYFHERALKKAKNGQYTGAAEDIVTGMQILQPLRYSDLTSVAVVGGLDRRMLRSLSEMWPKVPSDERGVISGKLEELKPDPQSIDEILHQERKVAVVEESKALEIAAAKGEKLEKVAFDGDMNIVVKVARNTEGDCLEMIEKLQKG